MNQSITLTQDVVDNLSMQSITITQDNAGHIDTIQKAPDNIIMDTRLFGFGVRIYPSGAKSYMACYRINQKQRRVSLGSTDKMSFKDARKEAASILASAMQGKDESQSKKPPSIRFSQFEKEYFKQCSSKWQKSTHRTYKGYMRNRILPFFKNHYVDQITRPMVAKWYDKNAQEKMGAATRSYSILISMMYRAEDWGYRPENTNPCRGIKVHPKRCMTRYLTIEELARLGEILKLHERRSHRQVNILKLLLFTGCRAQEIMNLKWDYIKDKALYLPTSKTGAKKVLLGEAAYQVIKNVKKYKSTAYLFPGGRKGTVALSRPFTTINDAWYQIRKEAELNDVRIHDLRHTFASHAVQQGHELLIVGNILGHKKLASTARYAHLADKPVMEAAQRIGERVAGLL